MKTITEIKNEFASASLEEKKALCQLYAEDERSGVRKLIEKCRKEEAALEKELLRMEHMMEYEHKYEHLGYLRSGKGTSCRPCGCLRCDPSKRSWDSLPE